MKHPYWTLLLLSLATAGAVRAIDGFGGNINPTIDLIGVLAEALGAGVPLFSLGAMFCRWKGFNVGCAAVLVSGVLSAAGNRSIQPQQRVSTVRAPEMKVFVSSQSAEEATQANMNAAFLKNLETYTIDLVKQRTAEFLTSQGQAVTDANLASEATYVESGTKKLAVVRIGPLGKPTQGAFVVGIVGEELKRVLCIRSVAGEIPVPITYGECGAKVAEVFGVDFRAH